MDELQLSSTKPAYRLLGPAIDIKREEFWWRAIVDHYTPMIYDDQLTYGR